MRNLWGVFVVPLVTWMGGGFVRETAIMPDLGKIADGKGWSVHNASGESVKVNGKTGVRLKAKADSATGIAGLVLADGIELTSGVIELDLKGRDVRPSFLGVAFGVADEKTFEAIYFRPFNFQAAGDFKNRAVQYISWPEHTWEELRRNRPGKFESQVNSVPDPNNWFHARIDVDAKRVRVYVNGERAPCLTVDRLSGGASGRRMGLFVDSGDGQYANLKVIKGT